LPPTHNICPNSFLLLSNFATLYEGYLEVRLDIRLWQFFYRVKKETKDKAMVNCGIMNFVLRTKRVFPALASHESVQYWNAGWFYAKNISVPGVHDGLPAFANKPPEELASWSFIPALAQYPELDRDARRISWIVHDGLTGMDLTLSWFTRRIQPLKYNKRMICEYSGVEDQLRVTHDNLPTDSLNKRIRTLVKITRGQPVPEICKDIAINNKCPPVRICYLVIFASHSWNVLTFSTFPLQLNTLAEDSFRNILRVPASAEETEEDPEDGDEGEEQAPKKIAPRAAKRPRAKVSGPKAVASGKTSTKKAKTKPLLHVDSKKVERDRIKLLATAGKGSRPIIPGAT
jgi:hypothetical protein